MGPDKGLNPVAQHIIGWMCCSNETELGLWKRGYILVPKVPYDDIKGLDNGWSAAKSVVRDFAVFLRDAIYEQEGAAYSDSEDEGSQAKTECEIRRPWDEIKSVIDIFDKHIFKLQNSGRA
jgi:hypothetical protein